MIPSSFVVVGGSSGIGFEITRRLAAKGHRVTVISRTIGRLETADNISHLAMDVAADTIDPSQLPAPIQGMTYCPGSIRLRPFHRLSAQNFLNDWQLNCLGAVNCLQACLPGLKKATAPGSIVLFSTVAVNTGMPFHTSIASAKGAVEGLTRSLAAELAPRIRVNAIAPSLTDTPLAGKLLSDEKKRSAASDRHPMKRVGLPDDIASAAVFLLEETSAWITGQVLRVDGGISALRTFR